ncbi:MAG: hypothetical protein AAFW46_14290 [Pseudomonadota bacterium]
MIAETLATAAPYALTFAAGAVVAWVAACFVIDGRDYRRHAKVWKDWGAAAFRSDARATRYERALQTIAACECLSHFTDDWCNAKSRCATCEARAALDGEAK